MKFDKIVTKCTLEGTLLEYGLLEGIPDLTVFIKAGAGGTACGENDKYLKMARLCRDIAGATVICAPNTAADSFDLYDRAVLAEHARGGLYFIGSSNGAYQGLNSAARALDFRKMLLINMPLMINFHKSKRVIESLENTELIFVYSEHDPSALYIPYLASALGGRGEVHTVAGANHTFNGKSDEFISLAKLLF